jgi:hypothetical protein
MTDLFDESLEGSSDALRQGIAIERAAVRAKRTKEPIRFSEPLADPKFRILNLGAGVQSSALALMSARGELEMLDYAIFADTGEESTETYAYLDWLEQQVPFPVLRVRREGLGLGDYLIEGTKLSRVGRQMAPFFTAHPDGMMPKHCSKEFKTRVVQLAMRHLLNLGYGEHGPREPVIEQWLGMTTDETHRVSVSEKRYLHQRYPLIELHMAKRDLYPWYEQRQLTPPPKSSCIFCPLNLPQRLAKLLEHPIDGPRLVAFDAAIRPGYAGMEGEVYLTRERKPILECDLKTPEQSGQSELDMDGCGDGDSACGV